MFERIVNNEQLLKLRVGSILYKFPINGEPRDFFSGIETEETLMVIVKENYPQGQTTAWDYSVDNPFEPDVRKKVAFEVFSVDVNLLRTRNTVIKSKVYLGLFTYEKIIQEKSYWIFEDLPF